jgi:hypothetical protein
MSNFHAKNAIMMGYVLPVPLHNPKAHNSQIIPRSKTLEEYESRDFQDETPIFSSFTYLIDLTRISGSLLSLDAMPAEYLESATVNADAMLVNWKLHLPREKQSVVDKTEETDEVLFQAQNMLQM